jgi:sulfate permease, SulP family
MTPKLFTTLRDYNRRLFVADALAGLTVALVALPLSIAIGIASGATPAAGLITAIVAGFLISALGGSRVQIGGPTGAFIVVVYGVIHQFGYQGLLVATLMAGLILLIAGLLRCGQFIRLIPEPVIEGFTLGIALIIAVSQIKDLVGLDTGALPAAFIPKVRMLWSARTTVDGPALAMGTLSIGAILVLRRLSAKIPWLVVVLGVGSLVAAAALPSVATVASRYGALPSHLPAAALPSFNAQQLVALFPAALTIAFLAGIESLLSAMVADRMIAGAHRSNAELIAQGVANLASPLFGGLPATGAIARTATNVAAGGRTPVAGMLHAGFVLAGMLFLSEWVGYLVLPSLAGLLVVTAWTMSEPHRWRERLRLPVLDLALLLLTAVLTVLADLTVAIALGTALGLALQFARGDRRVGIWHVPKR